MTADLQRVHRAQDRLLEVLAGHAGVNGVGIARGEAGSYVLKVNLREAAARAGVPEEVDGVPVQVQTVGPIRKRPVS